MSNNLIEYFATQQGKMMALLRQLVEMESPTENKAAIDRLGAFIASQLQAAGASVEVVPQTTAGDHIVASLGDANGAPIVTLCHIDLAWRSHP